MIRKLLTGVAALAASLSATAARAEWHQATSNNFIVYSQSGADAARDFAAKLERFHYVLRTFHRISATTMPNRLRVFLLSSAGAVGRTAGSASIAGYYVPDARGLMLVGTSARGSNNNGDPRSAQSEANLEPESILLHEYTHHFMYQYFPAAYPTWYSEGFAEFWGATRFGPNDSVQVGGSAEHRFSTFQNLGWLPLDRLLRIHNYREAGGFNVFLLYAEGWLLVRYTFEHPDRQRQLQAYLRLINNGTDYAAAAQQAFPDLGTFNSELFSYAGSGRFNVLNLPFRTIDVGPINITTPGPAEQALMMQEIKLSQGYPQREAVEFAADVRGIAARFPSDPFALRLVMESAYLAGDTAGALDAANRLLAVEPDNGRALMTKGLIQVAGLAAAQNRDPAAWTAARAPLVRAKHVAPRDPLVLRAFYRGFALQGGLPPEDAQNALYDAMELAPSDGEIRYELARDFEQRRMIPEAIAIIRPEANSFPHCGNESEGDRRRREQEEERNRQAGTVRHETPLEMLNRLQAMLTPHDQQRQTEAGH
jgi:tetratricopeptide (TPR) repeat protein